MHLVCRACSIADFGKQQIDPKRQTLVGQSALEKQMNVTVFRRYKHGENKHLEGCDLLSKEIRGVACKSKYQRIALTVVK